MSKRKRRRHLTRAEKLDITIADAVALKPKGLPGKAMAAFRDLGDQEPLFGAAAGVLTSGLLFDERRTAIAGVRMLAALGLATFAKTIVKNRIDRTRPDETLAKNRYKLDEGKSRDGNLRSLPSGHSAGAVAVARAAARDYPAASAALGVGAAAIAAAQLPSRAHFLTDVLAGAAVGWASEWIASAAIDAALRPARP